MQVIKMFFYPILLLIQIMYFIILSLRNILYNYKLLPITKFKINIISVGSLKFGGAGKTPLVEYLIQEFGHKKIAVLSRGYKRKTKGFLIASKKHNSFDIGDEVSQILHKYPNLLIAVSENRVSGVKNLIKQNTNIKTIILDDAHQHRQIAKNLNILVTEYEKLYSTDKLFPLGNLRDNKKEAQRANIIVVTKCPEKISSNKKKEIQKSLFVKEDQKIFFSYIKYHPLTNYLTKKTEDFKMNEKYFLLTGIASSKPLLNYLKNQKINLYHFKYPDHHYFNKKELNQIITKGRIKKCEILILTEKDLYRLTKSDLVLLLDNFKLLYMKIEFDFINNEKLMFNKQIIKFI